MKKTLAMIVAAALFISACGGSAAPGGVQEQFRHDSEYGQCDGGVYRLLGSNLPAVYAAVQRCVYDGDGAHDGNGGRRQCVGRRGAGGRRPGGKPV